MLKSFLVYLKEVIMRSFFIFAVLIFSVESYGFGKNNSCKLVVQQDVAEVVGMEPQYKPITLVYPDDIFEDIETKKISREYDKELLDAVKNNDLELVCELLVKGAYVNTIGEEGNTLLISAIKNNNVELAKFLLLHPEIDVNIQNDANSTALIESIKANLDETSLLLLDKETIDVNLVGDRWNWNALNWALHSAEAGNVIVVRKLLSRPDIEINPRVASTEPPIMIAAIRSWVLGFDVINQILRHPDLNAGLQDADGENALIGAARYGNLYLINTLLKRDGVDVNHYMFRSGFTPLSIAAAFGQVHVINTLLEVPGINVNNDHVHLIDYYGHITPLMEASYMGHTSIVRKLLAIHNIDSIAMDGAGKTALDHAVLMQHIEIADMLKTHMHENIDLTKLKTTIHSRCANGFAQAVPMVLRNVDGIHCADPNWNLTQESVDAWLEDMQTQLEAIQSVD